MAASLVAYNNKGPGDFMRVPFRYRDASHVKVYADGELVDSSKYSFTAYNTILAGGSFPDADHVLIRRETPVEAPTELGRTATLHTPTINTNSDKAFRTLEEHRDLLDIAAKIRPGETIEAGRHVVMGDDGYLRQGSVPADVDSALEYAERAEAAAASADVANAPAIIHGKRGILMKDKNGAITEGAPIFVSAYDWGARPGSGDNTAFFEDALFEIRNAGGGRLHLGAGRWRCDEVDYDYLPGGYSKFVMSGEGWNTILEKRVDNNANFLTLGKDDSTQIYQGGLTIKDLHIKGFSGGEEHVCTLTSLTGFSMQNVRVSGGSRAIHLVNCVTGNLYNCFGTDSERGLSTSSIIWPDSTFSAANLISIFGGAFKDNHEWGVVFAGGSMLNFYGTQIENNGNTGAPSGGMYVAPSAGDVGTYRKFRAVQCHGVWFESNKGTGAAVLGGGASTFTGCAFVANVDALRDLYSDGGKYVLVDCSMVNGKPGGNIEDTANAAQGNLIVGGEICMLPGIDETKTTLIDVQMGTAEDALWITRRKGFGSMQSSTTEHSFFQMGIETGESGSGSVTFSTPFGSTPLVFTTPSGNDGNKVKSIQINTRSTTGFTYVAKEIANGTDGAVASTGTGDAFQWVAFGQMA